MIEKSDQRKLVKVSLILMLVLLAAPVFGQRVLIYKGSEWYFSNGEDAPDSSWSDLDFDDSKWSYSAAPIGYGDLKPKTELTHTGKTRPATSYFRTMFEINQPSSFEGFEAELLVDDGAIVYLNGKEIYRTNMPKGKVGAKTLAASSVDTAPTFENFTFSASQRLHLLDGDNVLAVEVHQDKIGSADMIFDFTLTATGEPSGGSIAASARAPKKKKVFGMGSKWKFRDLRPAPGFEWNQLEFDDASWKEGSGPLGYGDNHIRTELDYGGDEDNRPITAWFRKSFTVDDPLAANLLNIEFLRDDGAVIYLNGTELLRSNMPPGYVDALTEAKSWVNDKSEEKIREATISAEALVKGNNVIAVEIHQKGADSSDLGFDMSLEIEFLPGGMKRNPIANTSGNSGGNTENRAKPIIITDPDAVAKAKAPEWRATAQVLLKLAMKAHSAGNLKEAVKNYYPSRWADAFSRRASGIDAGLKSYLLDPKQAAVSQEFFDLISQFDDSEKVFAIMDQCFRSAGETFREYPKLALAIALVYDQKPPKGWPHHQVSSKLLPRRLPDPVKALQFWSDSDTRGKTLHQLKTLTLEELKYVVDTPVPFDELAEAQKVRARLADLSPLYKGIKYDFDRLHKRVPNWPHEKYTLPEIAKLGGICVDQAYYTVQIAKAQGVPSMLISGAGQDGNHAWVGFLDKRGRWNFEVGRYPESNFVTGEMYDPQTWRRPSDHEIALLSERYRNTSKYRISRIHSLFAEQYLKYGKIEEAIKASQSAITSEDRNLPAWETLISAKRAAKATPTQLDQIYEDGAKAFSNYADLEASFLRRLSASLDQQGKAEEAEKLRSRIISRNRRERPDLALEEAKKELEKARKTESPDKQLTIYKRHINRFKDAGLIAYYGLAEPFLKRLEKDGKKDMAREALKYTQKRLKSKDDSTLVENLDKWEKRLEE